MTMLTAANVSMHQIYLLFLLGQNNKHHEGPTLVQVCALRKIVTLNLANVLQMQQNQVVQLKSQDIDDKAN